MARADAASYLEYDTSTPVHTERYLLEHYDVKAQVGKGAFGSAHVAIDKATKKAYVLKRVRLARQSERQRAASYLEMALASHLRHAHVIHFKEAWVEKGHTICMVLSYCEGGDLAALLQRRANAKRHFSEAQVKKWMCQSLLGVEYIHGLGVLHRDLKSSNLFITSDGDLQIGDFGLAKVTTSSQQTSRSLVGTPNYMCPEHFYHRPYDVKGDVWSLGCVFYEMAALRPAFSAFNMAGLVAKIKKGAVAPLPSAYASGVTDVTVKGMLRKHPENRLGATELLALEYLASSAEAARANASSLAAAMLNAGEWPTPKPMPPGGRSGSPEPGDRESPRGAKPSPRASAKAASPTPAATAATAKPRLSPRIPTGKPPAATPAAPHATGAPPVPSPRRSPAPSPPAPTRAQRAARNPSTAAPSTTKASPSPPAPRATAASEARKRQLDEASRALEERQAERRRRREEAAARTARPGAPASARSSVSRSAAGATAAKPAAVPTAVPRWAQPTAAAAARVASAARRAITGTASATRRAASSALRTASPTKRPESARVPAASPIPAGSKHPPSGRPPAARELIPNEHSPSPEGVPMSHRLKRSRDETSLKIDDAAQDSGFYGPDSTTQSDDEGVKYDYDSFALESYGSSVSAGGMMQPYGDSMQMESLPLSNVGGNSFAEDRAARPGPEQPAGDGSVMAVASEAEQLRANGEQPGGRAPGTHGNATPTSPPSYAARTPSPSPPRPAVAAPPMPSNSQRSPGREDRIENPFMSHEFRSAAAHSTLVDRVKRLEDTVGLAAKLLREGRLQELRQVLAGAASKGGVLCPISFAAAPSGSPAASATTSATMDATQACLGLAGDEELPAPLRGPFQLGDRVVVGRRRKLSGHIRYYGATAFGDGDFWVGIELEMPEGRNSGVVQGIRYFPCKPNCGLFVRAAVWESNAVRNDEAAATGGGAAAVDGGDGANAAKPPGAAMNNNGL